MHVKTLILGGEFMWDCFELLQVTETQVET